MALAMAALACVRVQAAGGVAPDLGAIAGAIAAETETIAGMVDDLPPDVDPPSRDELGLARPITPGMFDYHADYREPMAAVVNPAAVDP